MALSMRGLLPCIRVQQNVDRRRKDVTPLCRAIEIQICPSTCCKTCIEVHVLGKLACFKAAGTGKLLTSSAPFSITGAGGSLPSARSQVITAVYIRSCTQGYSTVQAPSNSPPASSSQQLPQKCKSCVYRYSVFQYPIAYY